MFGRSKQLLLNKFIDPSTPSIRKGRDGGKTGGGEIRMMKIVATTSLPAVDCLNADCELGKNIARVHVYNFLKMWAG